MDLGKRHFIFSCVFFVGIFSQATTTLVSVAGASRTDGIGGTGTQYVYGGMAGDYSSTSCPTDTSAVCDTCALVTGLEGCSFTSIRPTMVLTFTLKSTNPTGTFKVKHNSNDITPDTTPTGVTKDSEYSVTVKWSTLCVEFGSDVNCTSSSSWNGTLNIGWDTNGDGSVDDATAVQVYFNYLAPGVSTYTDCETTSTSNGQGFCHFKALRGDNKVFISQLTVDSTFPATASSNISYMNAILFIEPVTTNTTDAISALSPKSDYYELTVETDKTPPVADDRVYGTQNGTQYCFMLANRDVTGIVSNMTPSAITTNRCATPDEVKGLLDGKGCFITTAAYGSNMAPEVETFRHFRSEFLVKTSFGREFVRLYYEHSPYWADLIKQSEIARAAVRGALWPVLMIVNFIMAVGFKAFLGVIIGLIGMAVSLLRHKGAE